MEPIQGGKYKFDVKLDNSNPSKVQLETKIGGKTYSITASFDKPMDQNKIEQYLKQKSTIEKIDLLVNKYQLVSQAYSHKPYAKVKLTSKNEVTVDFTKVIKDKDETKYQSKTKTFVMDANQLENKIKRLEDKKIALKKEIEAKKCSPEKTDLKQMKEQQQKIESLESKLKNLDRRIETINELKQYVIVDFIRLNEDEKEKEKFESEPKRSDDRQKFDVEVKHQHKEEEEDLRQFLQRNPDEFPEYQEPPSQ